MPPPVTLKLLERFPRRQKFKFKFKFKFKAKLSYMFVWLPFALLPHGRTYGLRDRSTGYMVPGIILSRNRTAISPTELQACARFPAGFWVCELSDRSPTLARLTFCSPFGPTWGLGHQLAENLVGTLGEEIILSLGWPMSWADRRSKLLWSYCLRSDAQKNKPLSPRVTLLRFFLTWRRGLHRGTLIQFFCIFWCPLTPQGTSTWTVTTPVPGRKDWGTRDGSALTPWTLKTATRRSGPRQATPSPLLLALVLGHPRTPSWTTSHQHYADGNTSGSWGWNSKMKFLYMCIVYYTAERRST